MRSSGKRGARGRREGRRAGEKLSPQGTPGMHGEVPQAFRRWTCEEEAGGGSEPPGNLQHWVVGRGIPERGGTSVGKVDLEAGGEIHGALLGAARALPTPRGPVGEMGGCDSTRTWRRNPTWVPRAGGGAERPEEGRWTPQS